MNQVESQTNILMGAIRRWHIFFFIRVINEMTTASQPQKIKNWKLKWIHYLRIKNKPIRQIVILRKPTYKLSGDSVLKP